MHLESKYIYCMKLRLQIEITRDITSVYAVTIPIVITLILKNLVNNDDLSKVSKMNPKID